jgi:hypothetical protein
MACITASTTRAPDGAPAGTGAGARLSARRSLLILLLLCGAQFLVVLDATIVGRPARGRLPLTPAVRARRTRRRRRNAGGHPR